MSHRKKIHQNDITGQRGINLIEKVTLEMGFVWYPTGLEAGIDGYIEVRDSVTQEVTNCIVQVQSKATLGPLGSADGKEFSYLCDEADLKYWLSGTAPVVLIRCNPTTGEAYWASIKDRFATPQLRNARKIVFNKERDRFDPSVRDELIRLAVPKDSGLYLSPIPRKEVLESNLLHVAEFPATYFVAEATCANRKEGLARLLENHKHIPSSWIVKSKMVYSLHDLSKEPLRGICEPGSMEELPLGEWAFDEDMERTKDFVQLLNLALSETVRASGIGFEREKHLYYFWPPRDNSDKQIGFQARVNASKKFVFKAYGLKLKEGRVSFYRHSAFRANFRRVDRGWYLEINPTYLFTSDGKRVHSKHSELLTKINRYDGALAVANQVVMWASYLRRHDLFSNDKRLLGFGDLATFEVTAGIDDKSWLKSEEDETRLTESSDERQLNLELL